MLKVLSFHFLSPIYQEQHVLSSLLVQQVSLEEVINGVGDFSAVIERLSLFRQGIFPLSH